MANEESTSIVCPLSLKIAMASDGRLGAIQSYRCAYRPNLNNGKGAWETRPQKKTDKWASDFFKVLNAPRGEEITLSDNETIMKGLGRDSTTRFEFTQSDGEAAFDLAIRKVKAGELRAPRSWDRTFADKADMSLDELKRTYPELYQPTSRGSRQNSEPSAEIEELGEGFFDDDEEVTAAVPGEPLDEEDEEIIADEEDEYEVEMEEEQVPSYSVMAELELEEPTTTRTQTVAAKGTKKELKIHRPASGQMVTIHAGCAAIRADMGGEYIMFYKVKDPDTGERMWLQEGENEDHSNFILTVR